MDQKMQPCVTWSLIFLSTVSLVTWEPVILAAETDAHHISAAQRQARERANNHLLRDNLAILLPKQTKDAWGCLVTDHVAAHKSASVYDPTSIAPLWLYADEDLLKGSIPARRPNLAPEFMEVITAAVGGVAPSPEDVFAYIYAMLYSPSYRSHYGDFLKRDFSRVPLPRSAATFAQLAAVGHELIKLHLLKNAGPAITRYPKAGSNRVEKVEFKPDAADSMRGNVFINSVQFFEGVPSAVWEYTIGGYQVATSGSKTSVSILLAKNISLPYPFSIASSCAKPRIFWHLQSCLRLQPMQIIGGLLGVAGGGEDRPLVVFQDFQPTLNIN
jgi:hypothetical protein